MAKQRVFLRLKTEFPLRGQSSNGVGFRALATDLSTTGMGIFTDSQLQEGDQVRIRFRLPKKIFSIEANAKVMRFAPAPESVANYSFFAGLLFEDASAGLTKKLTSYISKNLRFFSTRLFVFLNTLLIAAIYLFRFFGWRLTGQTPETLFTLWLSSAAPTWTPLLIDGLACLYGIVLFVLGIDLLTKKGRSRRLMILLTGVGLFFQMPFLIMNLSLIMGNFSSQLHLILQAFSVATLFLINVCCITAGKQFDYANQTLDEHKTFQQPSEENPSDIQIPD